MTAEPSRRLGRVSEPDAIPATFNPGFTDSERLRLFAFTTAEKSISYLWVLRAMERSRANYVVLQHAAEVSASLASLAQDHPSGAVPALAPDEVNPLLDPLGRDGLDLVRGGDAFGQREAVSEILQIGRAAHQHRLGAAVIADGDGGFLGQIDLDRGFIRHPPGRGGKNAHLGLLSNWRD